MNVNINVDINVNVNVDVDVNVSSPEKVDKLPRISANVNINSKDVEKNLDKLTESILKANEHFLTSNPFPIPDELCYYYGKPYKFKQSSFAKSLSEELIPRLNFCQPLCDIIISYCSHFNRYCCVAPLASGPLIKSYHTSAFGQTLFKLQAPLLIVNHDINNGANPNIDTSSNTRVNNDSNSNSNNNNNSNNVNSNSSGSSTSTNTTGLTLTNANKMLTIFTTELHYDIYCGEYFTYSEDIQRHRLMVKDHLVHGNYFVGHNCCLYNELMKFGHNSYFEEYVVFEYGFIDKLEILKLAKNNWYPTMNQIIGSTFKSEKFIWVKTIDRLVNISPDQIKTTPLEREFLKSFLYGDRWLVLDL